jgi:hypothetical protein
MIATRTWAAAQVRPATTELIEEGGVLRTDRDAPVHIRLGPPA